MLTKMLFEFNEMNNSESDKKCESEMMKIFAPVLERNRFLTLKEKIANYFYLERNLRTKKVFLYFTIFCSIANEKIFPTGH